MEARHPTVFHRANVMAKMKAKSLPHLVRMALASGFGRS